MPGIVRIAGRTSWIVWSVAAIAVAVVASAFVNGQVADSAYPLASVVAAAALGCVGVSVAATPDRFVFRRVVVDVAVFASVLGWVGVTFHLAEFAELQAQGWRAAANLGYANVTALLLLVGLLCACAGAVDSQAFSDVIRCWLIGLGLLATQSRGAFVALAVCWLILLLTHRAMAAVLARALVWAAVAFVGLVPTIESRQPDPVLAIVGVVIAVAMLAAVRPAATAAANRILLVAVGAGAAVAVYAQLNTRIADGGSDDGRMRIWRETVSSLHRTGWAGAGPGQIASFSRGGISQLFAHDDPLQFAEYYGVFGVIALLVVICCLVVVFVRSRRRIDPLEWALGLTTTVAVGLCALVDFPLEVPLIPGVAALVIG